MANEFLTNAKKVKNDEFYTQYSDIQKEIEAYLEYNPNVFRSKVVYCNCDDPFESNFFKYFAANFNALGLKKLITTSYNKSPIAGRQLPLFEMEGLKSIKPKDAEAHSIEINEVPDINLDGSISLEDVKQLLKHDKNTSTPLKDNGDFRSDECIELLKQSDIVCTNPPFSLFREYIAQLTDYAKKFLIIGNTNAITYQEVFKLIEQNKVWLGINNGPKVYQVPDYYEQENIFTGTDGKKYAKMGNTGWFTNIDFEKRHEVLQLYKKYAPENYPKYDNYDAIEVSKISEIPVDYDGVMGVPVTFLDRYNPEQFKILGITDRHNISGLRTKTYTIADDPKYNDLNRRGAIKTNDGYKLTYARILIKRKKIK